MATPVAGKGLNKGAKIVFDVVIRAEILEKGFHVGVEVLPVDLALDGFHVVELADFPAADPGVGVAASLRMRARFRRMSAATASFSGKGLSFQRPAKVLRVKYSESGWR